MLTPIRTQLHVASGNSLDLNPGRPFTPKERLPVPGTPQAEINRPEHSPGVIPVGENPTAAQQTDDADVIDQVDQQKEQDIDYQIITRVLDKESHHAEFRNEVENDSKHNRRETNDPPGKPTAAAENEAQLRTPPIAPPQSQPPTREVAQADPLAFDLNGDGLKTTGIEHAIDFDINGDGITDHTSFIAQGDAFLALDRNNNSVIDSGLELFGDQYAAANGFLELQKFDTNQDHTIDAADDIFAQLKLLSLDGNGEQQLQSLSQAGIRSINLQYDNTRQALNAYDSVTQISSFEKTDGTTGEVGDVTLGYQTKA